MHKLESKQTMGRDQKQAIELLSNLLTVHENSIQEEAEQKKISQDQVSLWIDAAEKWLRGSLEEESLTAVSEPTLHTCASSLSQIVGDHHSIRQVVQNVVLKNTQNKNLTIDCLDIVGEFFIRALRQDVATTESLLQEKLNQDSLAEKTRAQEKLLKTMEMRSHFIAMVSHEMRTPLTTLRESTSLLQEMAHTKLSPEETKILDLTQRNLDRLVRFSQEVLDFSRLESGRLTINKKKTNLRDLLEHLAQTTQPMAKKKSLDLRVSISPDLPEVSIDSDKISQVVINFLNNAIKFTPSGGKIVLSASAKGTRQITISVQDNGIGISKEHQDRAFDTFVHLPHPANTAPGAGLGLSISKRLIELHGGQVRLDSGGEGKGCRFSFDLPKE